MNSRVRVRLGIPEASGDEDMSTNWGKGTEGRGVFFRRLLLETLQGLEVGWGA